MLDYLLGDSSTAVGALGEELAEKYDSIWADVRIGGEEYRLERNWKEHGTRTKISINGEVVDQNEFSPRLLDLLEIPRFRFPQGDPYSEKAWPEISWRMLFRHIYRQEIFWSDFADKQPPGEQHAVLASFLGLGRQLFPVEYGELVDRRRRRASLQAKREQFDEVLAEVTQEIIASPFVAVGPTDDSIRYAIEHMRQEITILQDRKDAILEGFHDSDSARGSVEDQPGGLDQLLREWQEISDALAVTRESISAATRRLDELSQHRYVSAEELSRLERARDASRDLATIKATHCPVCDRELAASRGNEETCHLCLRPYEGSGRARAGTERIEFEIEQLEQEVLELDELIGSLERDVTALSRELQGRLEGQRQLENLLQPARSAAAALVQPEISIADHEIGRLEEQISQMERLKSALSRRDDILRQLHDLQLEILELDETFARAAGSVNLEGAGQVLADGMVTYLNALKEGDPDRWPEDRPIDFHLRERGSFTARLGGSSWTSALGATLRCYFLLAYQYSLLSLRKRGDYFYPGLAIIDFPPELLDEHIVGANQNFLVEPFVSLLGDPEMQDCQLIVAGRAFDLLRGAHTIPLSHVWI